jgi:DNA (cytosine-5)-methyltransferase 1
MTGLTLELFSCSGGLAEGLRRAGIIIDMAFDFDIDACDSYERNLGHRPVRMDVRDLLRMVRGGWSPGEIGLAVFDPPCTPWSRAGKRQGQADKRDMLDVTVELIDLLRPRSWIIANVPGLDDSANWEAVVKPIIGGMASRCGYCVDYAKLNCADYSVPQKRIRPWWFGHPTGTPCIEWPHPTHCKPPVLPGCGLKSWVTCRDALAHLPIEELGRPINIRKRGTLATRRAGKKPRASNLDSPAGVVTCSPHQGDGTVLLITSPGRDGRNGESQRGNANAIVLSERAAAILQGFPESWQFCGRTKRTRWSQIGQGMCPPMAHAVGNSIKKWMDYEHRVVMARANCKPSARDAARAMGLDPKALESQENQDWEIGNLGPKES